MKVLLNSALVLGTVFAVGTSQSVSAMVTQPIAPAAKQDNLIMARGGHGGGHHGGGHHGGGHRGGHWGHHGGHWGGHHGWGRHGWGGGGYWGPGWNYGPSCNKVWIPGVGWSCL